MAGLGELERDIMAQLWDADGPLTVRQVHERLSRHRDIAYTTVMTVLDRLAKKGVVAQQRADRAYRYTAAQTREEMTAALMLDALSATPDGPARDAALAHFVGRVGPAGAAALAAALKAAESR
ncbi:BlaI/MecI/CopY family transcriptional regulator [Dactylosporangium fulvum]|uniref:BlaI/MecI/CopY family transcriptional regulator n=1 Tax=Dactylosporangium fulvum TaxID=53359 RepID=A0ABY5WCB9_9ACTN|nr:BlaI/MecI/CopY family transcriptional regulator [Dactylosporangium fulvum]UWP87020.1 BlaI/MecI/CopY family transcriptional regulator [Dactylosporangium fulvum]